MSAQFKPGILRLTLSISPPQTWTCTNPRATFTFGKGPVPFHVREFTAGSGGGMGSSVFNAMNFPCKYQKGNSNRWCKKVKQKRADVGSMPC